MIKIVILFPSGMLAGGSHNAFVRIGEAFTVLTKGASR